MQFTILKLNKNYLIIWCDVLRCWPVNDASHSCLVNTHTEGDGGSDHLQMSWKDQHEVGQETGNSNVNFLFTRFALIKSIEYWCRSKTISQIDPWNSVYFFLRTVKQSKCARCSVCPDCKNIFSFFGHLQQWKFA